MPTNPDFAATIIPEPATLPLQALARAAGIETHWLDYRDDPHEVSPEVLMAMLTALGYAAETQAQQAMSLQRIVDGQNTDWPRLLIGTAGQRLRLPPGIRDWPAGMALAMEDGRILNLPVEVVEGAGAYLQMPPVPGDHFLLRKGQDAIAVALAPARGFSLPQGTRAYGIATQLYSLRRPGDGGIGDFGGLADFVRVAAAQGADAVAISPTHALAAAAPGSFAPYSPSNRLFLNALHAAPAAVLGIEALTDALARAGLTETFIALEELPLIDYTRAGPAKWQMLQALWEGQKNRLETGDDHAARSYRGFLAGGGSALRHHAVFEALHSLKAAQGEWDWRRWVPDLQNPDGPVVMEFARTHAHEVGFHAFVQWLTEESLKHAQAVAKQSGMKIGLIGDLAVGTDPTGSRAWSSPSDLLNGLAVGAPPDLLAPQGQNWGLTTFSPKALLEKGFVPFRELMRACLKHAGGLRIDHILGFQRLWLSPDGAAAGQGGYLRYPLDDMLKLVALESYRYRALMIGEDLGTVPSGLRGKMDGAGVLGMRVLHFQREHKLFIEPARWPDTAVAMTATHDLPTVAGFWSGRDLDWRQRLGLSSQEIHETSLYERDEARACLWGALTHAGLVSGEQPGAEEPEKVVDVACEYIARTPSPLALLPIEDVLGLREAPNLPGTTSGHPNWQQRLPGDATTLLDSPEVQKRLEGVRRERGTPAGGAGR